MSGSTLLHAAQAHARQASARPASRALLGERATPCSTRLYGLIRAGRHGAATCPRRAARHGAATCRRRASRRGAATCLRRIGRHHRGVGLDLRVGAGGGGRGFARRLKGTTAGALLRILAGALYLAARIGTCLGAIVAVMCCRYLRRLWFIHVAGHKSCSGRQTGHNDDGEDGTFRKNELHGLPPDFPCIRPDSVPITVIASRLWCCILPAAAAGS